MFFTNRHSLIAALSAMFTMMFMLFFDGILSLRLIDLGVNEDNVGYIFAIGPFCYSFSAPFAGYVCKFFKRRNII